MEKLHLPILVEIDEDGRYIVSCPFFKGCHSWGETIDEAMENILGSHRNVPGRDKNR
ncbi:MAG: type II toxin-antitoxin system HicB family antitoxin [Methanotrichaceae archaeon]|jgi:predicted RNase H-like HicB family nuclease